MDKRKLPDGWIIRRSTHYPDKQYYFNTKTKESTWKLPVSTEQTGKQLNAAGKKQAPAHGAAGKKNALFLPRQIQPATRPLPAVPKTPKADGGNSKTSEQPVQSGKVNSASIQLRWTATALSAQRQRKLAVSAGIFNKDPAKAESDVVKLKPLAPTKKVPVIHMTGTRPAKKSMEPAVTVTPAPQSKDGCQDVNSSNTLNRDVSLRDTDKVKSRQPDSPTTEKHAPRKKSKKHKKHSKSSKAERSSKEMNRKTEDEIRPGSKRKTGGDDDECIELNLYTEDEDCLEPKRKLPRRSEENEDVRSSRASSRSSSEQKTGSSRRRSHPSIRDSLTSSTSSDPEPKPSSFSPAESKNFSFSLKESTCDSSENSGVSRGDGENIPTWMNSAEFFAGNEGNTHASVSFASAQDINHNANMSDETDMEVDDAPAQHKHGGQNVPLEKMDEGEFLSSVTEEKYKAAAESGKRMIMVLDTCAMMDDLGEIKAALETDFPDFGLPIMVIPWVVVQELDAIKDNKRKSAPVMGHKQEKARRAVRFVSKCFESRHPRFVGQPAKEAKEEFADLIVVNNDDKILQCCLQCQNRNPQSCVLLLTKDINLCNKAAILGFDNYTAEKYPAKSADVLEKEKSSTDTISQAPLFNFEQNHTTPDTVSQAPLFSFEQNHTTPDNVGKVFTFSCDRNNIPPGANLPVVNVAQDDKSDVAAFVMAPKDRRPSPVPELPAKRRREPSPDVSVQMADSVSCKLKSVLQAALSPIVEKEMKTAYEDFWEKIILRKKPWTGVDVVENINKHFRAVFGYVVDRSLESRMPTLLKLLKVSSFKIPVVQEMVWLSTDLLMEFAKIDRYTEQLRPYLGQLRDLRNQLEPEDEPTPSPHPSSSLPPSSASPFPLPPTTPSHPPFVSPSPFPNSDPSPVPIPSPAPTSAPTPHPFATPAPFNPPTPVLIATASPALPGTAPSDQLPDSSANEKLVEAKFQLVWEVIHSFCEVAKTMMANGCQTTPSTPEQQQMLQKLPVLLPLLQPLYQTYASSLSSPEEMVKCRLCCMLNQFCSQLDIVNCSDEALSPDWVLQYFSSPTTRPTLERGLKQLEDMITSLGQFSSALGLSL